MATATGGFITGVLTTLAAVLVVPKLMKSETVAQLKAPRKKSGGGDLPARYVTDAAGERLRVRKRAGEWEYYYDREWTPLRYLGGPGHDWQIRGDRLIDRA